MAKQHLRLLILVFIGFLWLSSPLWAQIEIEQVNGHEAVAHEVLVKFRVNGSTSLTPSPELSASLAEIQSEYDISLSAPLIPGGGLYRMHSRTQDAGSLAQQLSLRSDVIYAEPNYIVHASKTPNDTFFKQLWGMRNTGQTVDGQVGVPGADISAASAWDVTTGSTRNVAAVVDTGIDYTHPDLKANMWSAPAKFTVTIEGAPITCAAGTHGFNAITQVCDPMDDEGHGTHVSGTLGTRGNNSSGVAGVNWTAAIMGAKAFDCTGHGATSDEIDAIEFTIQAKQAFASTNGANVRVLNNSWGGDAFSQALLDEIERANTNDMLFVAAAGNNGTDNDFSPHYPASYNAPNIIAVAATDNDDQLADFSNYGIGSVHLGAPGVKIYSTFPGAAYEYMDGTSMATPHVSGAALLVLSACSLDTAHLKSTLLGTVDQIPALATKTISGGRLNVNAAIRDCMGEAAGLGFTSPNFGTAETRMEAEGTESAAVANSPASPDGNKALGWGGCGGNARINISPLSLNFGPEEVGSQTAAWFVTITSSGTSALTVSGVTVAGLNPGDFLLSDYSGSCTTGTTLSPGATCVLGVRFSPQTRGNRSASLEVADNAAGAPHTVKLTGVGAYPVIIFDPVWMSHNFGPVPLGSSAVQHLKITSGGIVQLIESGVDLSGTNSADFQVSDFYGTCLTGMTLYPGDHCILSLTFQPSALGSRHALLKISDNAFKSPQEVELVGTGVLSKKK